MAMKWDKVNKQAQMRRYGSEPIAPISTKSLPKHTTPIPFDPAERNCPRCGQPTEIRRHKTVKAKLLKQPFYYSQWYYCNNPKCKTKQIMPDEFKVYTSAGSPKASAQSWATKALEDYKRDMHKDYARHIVEDDDDDCPF